MNRILVVSLLLLSTFFARAQSPSYVSLNQQAISAYKAKSYAESGKLYDEAFQQKTAKPTSTDYYNAACSWALTGNADKAFRYLDMATITGWDNVAHLKQDSDLTSLLADKRWPAMLSKLEAAVAKKEANINQPLKQELTAIFATDQGVRSKIDSVQKNFGMKSAQWESLMSEMHTIDARNTQRVTDIIDQYGWPGQSLVGRIGSLTAFLVIQHSDLPTQQKYLPMMREVSAKGELAKSSLALLEDRVLAGQGKPQLYGSQLRMNPDTGKNEFLPIEDETRVDERRAAMGLGPLAEYAKNFGLVYISKK